MRHPVLVVTFVLVATTRLVPLPPVAAATVTYAPPVQAPVVDGFRPPPHPYGVGNRGLEYQTHPGQRAAAVADGVVAFAGQVAGRLVVSIDHADGLRSSLTGLASISVAQASEVRRGDEVGTTAGSLHLGVREGQTYLDPAALFAARSPTGAVHLVPAHGALGEEAPPTRPVEGQADRDDGRSVPLLRGVSVVSCPPACKAGGPR